MPNITRRMLLQGAGFQDLSSVSENGSKNFHVMSQGYCLYPERRGEGTWRMGTYLSTCGELACRRVLDAPFTSARTAVPDCHHVYSDEMLAE